MRELFYTTSSCCSLSPPRPLDSARHVPRCRVRCCPLCEASAAGMAGLAAPTGTRGHLLPPADGPPSTPSAHPLEGSARAPGRSLLVALAHVAHHARFPRRRVLCELVLRLLLPDGHAALGPRLVLHLLEVRVRVRVRIRVRVRVRIRGRDRGLG